MAIKFSQFVLKTLPSELDYIVGYTGTENLQITPDNFLAPYLGAYLPLAGGTMAGNIVMGGNQIKFADAGRLYLGDSNDLQIYHNATDSHIDNYTGNLNIVNNANDKDINFYCDDGAGGVEIYFYLDGSNATGAPQTIFPENCYLNFGNNSDLKILHAGGNSTMQNDTGDWYMRQTANDKDIIILCDDGAGGHTPYITLDGSAAQTQVDMDFYFTDNVKAKFGDGGDLNIYHDGSNSYITDTGTGNLYIDAAPNFFIRSATDSAVGLSYAVGGPIYLYHAGSLKFNTSATGIEVADEVSIGTSLVHTGDTDTKVSFGTDEIVLTTAGVDRMFVAADGDVGIGTNTPSYNLEVDGTATVATDPSYIVATAGTFEMAIGSQNSPGVAQEAFVGTLGNTDFKIMANSAFVGRVTTSAKLLIGAGGGVPTAALQVLGDRKSVV